MKSSTSETLPGDIGLAVDISSFTTSFNCTIASMLPSVAGTGLQLCCPLDVTAAADLDTALGYATALMPLLGACRTLLLVGVAFRFIVIMSG
jgi:hypothetical protein